MEFIRHILMHLGNGKVQVPQGPLAESEWDVTQRQQNQTPKSSECLDLQQSATLTPHPAGVDARRIRI
jgi:hypothetical protein